jgi:hypothetical protein
VREHLAPLGQLDHALAHEELEIGVDLTGQSDGPRRDRGGGPGAVAAS